MDGIVDILLKIKKGVQFNIDFLNEMINIKQNLIDILISVDLSIIDDVYFDFKNNVSIESLEQQILVLKKQLKNINIKLFLLCEHTFIYDDIDTDLDNSSQICYCVKCEYSPTIV